MQVEESLQVVSKGSEFHLFLQDLQWIAKTVNDVVSLLMLGCDVVESGDQVELLSEHLWQVLDSDLGISLHLKALVNPTHFSEEFWQVLGVDSESIEQNDWLVEKHQVWVLAVSLLNESRWADVWAHQLRVEVGQSDFRDDQVDLVLRWNTLLEFHNELAQVAQLDSLLSDTENRDIIALCGWHFI